jgi:hypothetical protein
MGRRAGKQTQGERQNIVTAAGPCSRRPSPAPRCPVVGVDLLFGIFSNLKVWTLGVYHGLRRKHLQSYLDEFVFRFNRWRTRHAAFRSLLGIAVAQPPHPYKMLISPEAAV